MNTIIGQDHLVNNIKRILEIFVTSEQQIRPHFILTGASGSGKTMVVKAALEECGVSMVQINAAQITKEGFSGNSLSKALEPLRNLQNQPCVVFVDEWDKIYSTKESSLIGDSFSSLQDEFLKMLEGGNTSIFGSYGNYDEISLDRVLFIFAGSFNNQENVDQDFLRSVGVSNEFLGRASIIYNTNNLTLEDMLSILESSELLEKYLEIFQRVSKEDVVENITPHIRSRFENNSIGARLVTSLIHQYFILGGLPNEERVRLVL